MATGAERGCRSSLPSDNRHSRNSTTILYLICGPPVCHGESYSKASRPKFDPPFQGYSEAATALFGASETIRPRPATCVTERRYGTRYRGVVTEAVLRVLRDRGQQQSVPGHRNDDARLVLLIEGGSSRGAYSSGMTIAIEQLGLLPLFDAERRATCSAKPSASAGTRRGTSWQVASSLWFGTEHTASRSEPLFRNMPDWMLRFPSCRG
jgi:hypothetical protein